MSQDRMYATESTESFGESFAVFRNGHRVSDSIYPSSFYAQDELDYWKGIIKNWPDGSRIEIRKLHSRVSR